MFHNEEVKIQLTWRNNSKETIYIHRKPLGIKTHCIDEVGPGESLGPISVDIPELGIEFTFCESQIGSEQCMEPLRLEWVVVEGNGHFEINAETKFWKRFESSVITDDCFGIGTSKVTFRQDFTTSRESRRSGIVIVGILDIGGHGR